VDVVDNNYICFGTSNMNTCKTNPDTYMYRIIGISPGGKIKVIKMTELGDDAMQWYEDADYDIPWTESFIYQNLNGSEFLNNTTYLPSGWSSKISDTLWQHGYMTEDDFGLSLEDTVMPTGNDIYEVESKFSNKVTAKIGLMYINDYYYQLTNGACNVDAETGTPECQNGWLDILNNDTTTFYEGQGYEWSMTNYGFLEAHGMHFAGGFRSDVGGFTFINLNNRAGARPVFYLKSDITLTGVGTLDSPFIIN